LAVYTESMKRRLTALLIVLVMGLQGPMLAHAAGSAAATAGHCCPGQASGNAGNDSSSCPAGVLAGVCCLGSVSFTALLHLQISPLIPTPSLLPSESVSVSFATESPTPQFRPPIV